MSFLKSFSAIILAVTFSICVKAETHTVTFTNKCVAFVDSPFNPFSLTRKLDVALVLYVMKILNTRMTISNLFLY
jgi:hypothetical protein